MAEGGLFSPGPTPADGVVNVAASNTTYTSGTVVFSGSNNITVGTNGQTVLFSGPNTVAQSTGPGAVQASNATFTSGTVVISGGANVTVGTDAGQKITISAAAGGGGVAVQNSQTTYTSGTVHLADLANITIRSATGQKFEFSVNAQTVQTQNVVVPAASNTTFTSGTVVFSGSNAATVKSGAQSVFIDVPVQSVQTQQNIQSIAASNTTYHTGQVEFTGSQAVTVRSSANQRVVIDAPAQTVQTQNVVVPAASNTTYTSGTVVFSGGANITVGTNGQTITISAPNPGGGAAATLSRYQNLAPSGATASAVTLLGTNNGTINVFPLHPADAGGFPGAMTVSTVLFNLSLASANTSAQSWTFSFGVYTPANSTALSMLYQATSGVANAASSNNTTGWHGVRWLSLNSSQFSNSAGAATTPSFAAGSLYYGAVVCKSAGQTKGASLYGQMLHNTDARSGTLGAAAVANTSLQWFPWNGVYSSGTLPNVISRSSVNANNASSPFVPWILFENVISTY